MLHKMKILYITPYVPYPLNSGGNQAFFNMVDAARKEHSVSLLLYIHGSNDREAAKQLEKVWPDVSIECFDKKKTTMSGMTSTDMPVFARLQCAIFDSVRRSMERKIERCKNRHRTFTSQQTEKNGNKAAGFSLGNFVRKNSTLFKEDNNIDSLFTQRVYEKSRQGYDIVQVEFYEFLPLIYFLPDDVETVFVHHEIRFIRNENEMSLFEGSNTQEKVMFEQKKDKELAMLARFKHIIVLTDVDRKILGDYLPNKHIYVSPALTDAGKNLANAINYQKGQDLVFVGGGDHFPNADGVAWFCKEVVPYLQALGGSGKIHIVGKWHNKTRQTISTIYPEVLFEGFVDDLQKFINGKIAIVPIRIGSGMRMKILDVVSASSPMVTTTKGCEGLPFENNFDCFIADTPEDFAKCIVKLRNDEQIRKQMAENSLIKLRAVMNGNELIERRLDFYRELKKQE